LTGCQHLRINPLAHLSVALLIRVARQDRGLELPLSDRTGGGLLRPDELAR
jgi:hypothetical protein